MSILNTILSANNNNNNTNYMNSIETVPLEYFIDCIKTNKIEDLLILLPIIEDNATTNVTQQEDLGLQYSHIFIQYLNDIVTNQSYHIHGVDHSAVVVKILRCVIKFCRRVVLDRSTINMENIDLLCGNEQQHQVEAETEDGSEAEAGSNTAVVEEEVGAGELEAGE